MKILFLLYCFLGSVTLLKAQDLYMINGKISGDDDIENIHVINKSSKRFTISNTTGEFSIEAKLNDTIVFSAIQYSTREVIIDSPILISKTMHVFLNEEVNELGEVIVGTVLTGNLMLDVGNSTAEPEINFYNVGIPGYKGRRATKTERRLSGATSGLIGTVVNGITGETKRLKVQLEMVRKDELIQSIRKRLSDDFFSEHPLSEFKHMDFWYYCSDDSNFIARCKNKKDIEILVFLNEKYVQYMSNLKSE